MRRIAIIGGPGSGKSTLARELGRRLDLPVHHIDRLFWRPGWVETPRDELEDRLRALYAGPDWVIDGEYLRTWAARMQRADTVVFLDLPAPVRLWRVVARIATTYGRVRPDMAPGCPERLDIAFLREVAGYGGRRRAEALSAFAAAPPRVARYHLRSAGEVHRFLAALPEAAAAASPG